MCRYGCLVLNAVGSIDMAASLNFVYRLSLSSYLRFSISHPKFICADIMDANQSRRRTEAVHDGEDTGEEFDHLPYQALDPDIDSIRLLRIHPAENEDEELACALYPVDFAERPRYEALSYMWGDDVTEKWPIVVNGMKVGIRKNLWDAIHFLRDTRKQGLSALPIWIDALCINQSDVSERNRQLHLMRHIYFRAQTVVVWLGKRYSEYQANMQQDRLNVRSHVRDDARSSDDVSGQELIVQAMARELCADGYWDRLWIIQEITQARGYRGVRIQVCFGRLVMKWKSFMAFVAPHGDHGGGPLRLDRQLWAQYTGNHTLKQLLREHREAKCREPRDKVYVLVGLAADGRGFPMDYTKSLFEIWKDTMEFMNRYRLLKQDEIVDFGCLVRYLLTGSDYTLLQQSLGSFEPATSTTSALIDDITSPQVFHLQGCILGYIRHVGPHSRDYVANPGGKEVEQWERYVQFNFRDDLGAAHKENNALAEAILESTEPDLEKMCSNYVSTVTWKCELGGQLSNVCFDPDGALHNTYGSHLREMQKYNSDMPISHVCDTTLLGKHQVPPARGPRLVQIHEPWGQRTPYKMGISTNLVQHGDLICAVEGIRKVLIIRALNIDSEQAQLRIFGTGLTVADLYGYHPFDKNHMPHEGMPVKMDVRTLFVLLPSAEKNS